MSCALAALQLTEMDSASFEAVYSLILYEAYSGKFRPSTLFTAAKYLDSRGFSESAFPFTIQAIRQFVLTGLQVRSVSHILTEVAVIIITHEEPFKYG